MKKGLTSILTMIFSLSCSSDEVLLDSFGSLCLEPGELLEVRNSGIVGGNEAAEIVLAVKNLPVRFYRPYGPNELEASNSGILTLTAGSPSEAYIELLLHRSTTSSSELVKENMLYRIPVISDSALASYDYYRHEAALLDFDNIIDSRVAYCVEGIGGRDDRCRLLFTVDDLQASIWISHRSLENWSAITDAIRTFVLRKRCEN